MRVLPQNLREYLKPSARAARGGAASDLAAWSQAWHQSAGAGERLQVGVTRRLP